MNTQRITIRVPELDNAKNVAGELVAQFNQIDDENTEPIYVVINLAGRKTYDVVAFYMSGDAFLEEHVREAGDMAMDFGGELVDN